MMRIVSGVELELSDRALLAAGRAEPAVVLLIETALDMRDHADVHAETVAGVVLEMEAPAEMAPDALERAFAAIDAGATGISRRRSVRAIDDAPIRMPARLATIMRDAARTTGWRSLGPGIRGLDLGLPGEVRAQILRIAPSAATPRHTHAGREATLCLSGGFSDGRGSYGPGDVVFADGDVTHRPVADADGPCYVLAVTDARLRMTGMFGLLQRLLGR